MRGRVSWIVAVMGIVAALPLRVQRRISRRPGASPARRGPRRSSRRTPASRRTTSISSSRRSSASRSPAATPRSGTGSALGGLGHFSVGVRANAFDGLFPNTSNGGYPVSTTGAQRRTLATKDQWFGAPTADAAIGLFEGIPLALTNVLRRRCADQRRRTSRRIHNGDFSLDPSSNFQFGYGVRIGLLSGVDRRSRASRSPGSSAICRRSTSASTPRPTSASTEAPSPSATWT